MTSAAAMVQNGILQQHTFVKVQIAQGSVQKGVVVELHVFPNN